MRNNLQNDVKIENAKNFASKFNLSGSYSSTASVGEVTCKFSRLLQPGTKAMCGEESLVFLAPLVAPTYAKQHYKTWHNFVPVSDVWANYDAFISQQPISRNGQIIKPVQEPCIPKDGLSLFVLNGAKATLYARQLPDDFDVNNVGSVDMVPFISGGYFDFPSTLNVASGTTEFAKLYRKAVNAYWSLRSDGTPIFNVGSLVKCTPDALVGGTSDLELESGNMTLETFRREDVDVGQSLWYGYDLTTNVSMDKSDFNLYSIIQNGDGLDHSYIVCFAFRLSSWGIRLFKTLRGLGYGIDMDARLEARSILPLLAVYKTYWDMFGLNLWQNFESTYCGRLISYLEQTNNTNVWYNSTAWSLFKPFMLTEFGSMWLTEKNDYISAHLPQPVVSANNQTPLIGVIDAYNGSSGGSVEPVNNIHVQANDAPSSDPHPSMGYPDGHAYINSIQHGYLDSEILKRLYKRTNANTALGHKIADLMRAQGLGTYMERTRVNYIGETDTILDVQSVISQADTFKSAGGSREGAMLGQRGGRGVGYKKNDKKLYYKTDCLGYWICLESITCDSGWSQSEDVTLSAVNQHEKYQADYENLGLSLSPKSIINGSRNEGFGGAVGDSQHLQLSMSRQPFGFSPRMSAYKIGRSCLSGGFALRSMRDNFLGYNMDKVVLPDEFFNQDVTSLNVQNIPGPANCKKFIHMIGFRTKDVPTAGNPYRFLGRWPWMGNLLRIFAYEGTGEGYAQWLDGQQFQALAKVWEYHYRTEDNYILLGEIWFKAWSPMVPIEETYGTVDSDKKELEYVERC